MTLDFDELDRRVAEDVLGHCGRLLSGSKSGYHERHPEGQPIFNANVCAGKLKVWHGDLDLATEDAVKLQRLADVLDATVRVLYEFDGRFAHETAPLLNRAVATYEPESRATQCKLIP